MGSYRRAITFVLLFAALGSLLSGYLSYWNYFGPSCTAGPLSWLVSCGGPTKVLIFGQPTCIYGFVMFFLVFIIALVAAFKRPTGPLIGTIIALGVAGTLFSGGLVVYEVLILKLQFTTLPSCVYGLLFYLGILVSSLLGRHGLLRSLDAQASTLPQ